MIHLWKNLPQEVHKETNDVHSKVCIWRRWNNSNNEPDEQGGERKDWIALVTHDPADRQADRRWEGTIIQKKAPVRDIRWKGLYDKNSDKLYAPKQLLPQSDYEAGHRKYLRGASQNTGNCWVGRKKEISEI